MSKHVPVFARSTAMEGEDLLSWNRVEEKLAFKLDQLTKLLHHFSAFPPEAPDGNEDEIAVEHESEIHEILNETASRIREFKTSLEIQIQDNRVQETIEAMSSQYETLRKASEIELNREKSKAEQLDKDVKSIEKTLEDKTESFVRDLTLLRNELLTKTNECESAKQTYISEIARLKKLHESEILAQNAITQKELLELTQQLTRVQARVSELQEMAAMKLEEHTQALEETKALHLAEVERLKLEGFVELETMSQDFVSREAEWHAQEVEYQMKLTESEKEIMQITLSSKLQAQEMMSLFEVSKQTLTKEKEMTGKLRLALCQVEEENRTLKENLTSALSKKDILSIAFETLKKEALDAENTHSSAILEWESQANRFKEDLENMTNAFVSNEKDIKKYKVKVDELAFQLVENRKEMNLMVMEIDQLKKENEESSRKMKEILETRIQQQIQAHEQDVENLQKSFLFQLEEHRKGSEIQLESMEEKLLRQKEEKARAKEACAEYMIALRVVEQKMEDQELKFVSHFQTYEKKIVEIVQKLDTVESRGPALENDFNSLLKKVLKHTHQSKKVSMNLEETKTTCAALEKKLTAFTQEYIAETELLKHTLSEEDRAHNLAIAAASESHASQIQQCMNDMQRLKEEHYCALAELTREHQLEIDALSSKILAQKDAEMAEQKSKLESCLRRNKMECNEDKEVMALEHNKALRDLKGALEAAEKKEARLVRAHTNALKAQQEELEEGMERCKKECAEAIKASEAVSQKLAHELYDMKEDHMIQIREMNESFQLHLSSTEKEWRHRLETEQATSKKAFQSDTDELRHSLLTSFTEEKLKLETDWRKEIDDLQQRISELEDVMTQKDERIKGLVQVIKTIEESNAVALLEMKTSHKQNINDMMQRQRAELKELRDEGSAMIEELQTKHSTELQASQRSAAKANLQMREVKHELEGKLGELQKRLESRESRQEDVVCIMKLQESCLQKDSKIQQLHDKTSQLKLELVNREDTYNRIFGNSPRFSRDFLTGFDQEEKQTWSKWTAFQ